MTAPDLHPEELLDRAAAGTISADERTRLDAHLAVCPACRFEQQARADFAVLPAVAQVDDLVTRALAGLPSAARPMPRRASPMFVAAAVVLLGFGSLAAYRFGGPIAERLGLSSPPPAVAPPQPTTRTPPPVAPVPVEVEPPPPLPQLVETPTPLPQVRTRPIPPPVVVEPPAPPVTPVGLFRQATSARTSGDRVEAERLYRELAIRFPDSPEATVAHAVLGRLLIDLGRPAEGLRELEATLDGGPSSLREDALAHRAMALDALGDGSARAAWEQLLREFPSSIHARRARDRLEAIGPP